MGQISITRLSLATSAALLTIIAFSDAAIAFSSSSSSSGSQSSASTSGPGSASASNNTGSSANSSTGPSSASAGTSGTSTSNSNVSSTGTGTAQSLGSGNTQAGAIGSTRNATAMHNIQLGTSAGSSTGPDGQVAPPAAEGTLAAANQGESATPRKSFLRFLLGAGTSPNVKCANSKPMTWRQQQASGGGC